MEPHVVWGGLFLSGTAYELHAVFNDRKGCTLSEVTRALFRVHTPVGKVLFVAGWCALTWWLVPHIAFKVVEKAVEVLDEVAP